MRDIMDRLQDFDRHGNTATERYTMRTEAYFEIERLRRRVVVLETILAEDLYPWECSDDLNKTIVEDIHARGRPRDPGI